MSSTIISKQSCYNVISNVTFWVIYWNFTFRYTLSPSCESLFFRMQIYSLHFQVFCFWYAFNDSVHILITARLFRIFVNIPVSVSTRGKWETGVVHFVVWKHLCKVSCSLDYYIILVIEFSVLIILEWYFKL